MKVIMRKARRTDVDAMNRIFNDVMKIDGACLDIDPKDEVYWLEWFAGHDKQHPVFVGELDGDVICWAALNRYDSGYAYDGVAVLTMNIDPAVGLHGLQESLLRFVEAQAKELGFYKLIVSMFGNNRSALHIYRTAGFRDVGIYRNHAFYKGELVDVVFMERLLQVDMAQLQQRYRVQYPFYEAYFAREEAIQEYQMLRNGMVRSTENPGQWVPTSKVQEPTQEDWGGATIRPARNIPTVEEILSQRQADQRAKSLVHSDSDEGDF